MFAKLSSSCSLHLLSSQPNEVSILTDNNYIYHLNQSDQKLVI